ncbi:uncharacterized protein LOC130994545 [Salvia miltiorrhiza]|uniref:uncharacterized protein LOC130994545 n=1 Tax=Salvia miltiorrhiza TaxID=226208 RepID=UPI0025AC4654|nr:uncharacterized protein LOC130994545 [Salvia miltiorrhiza]
MVETLTAFISEFALCPDKEDGWIWKATKDGVFSTKSAYEVIAAARNEPSPMSMFKEELAQVWKTPAPHKAKVIAWRCLRNRLPTCNNLVKRNVPLGIEETWCNACVTSFETAEHLFLHCPKVEIVWDKIQQWIDSKIVRSQGIPQHFTSFFCAARGKNSRKFLMALWVCTIWLIWEKRNDSRFEGKAWDTEKLVLEIKGRLWS